MELVVALFLLSLSLPMLLNLVPGGRMAQRSGENLQAAAAYAEGWLEAARESPPTTDGVDRRQRVVLNGVPYVAEREATLVAPGLQDVVVTMTPAGRGKPFRLATRMKRNVRP